MKMIKAAYYNFYSSLTRLNHQQDIDDYETQRSVIETAIRMPLIILILTNKVLNDSLLL